MKKLASYFLAAALAFPAISLGAGQVSAQDRAQPGECHGGHHGGRGHGHHGGRGHGRHGGRGHGHRDPAAHVEHRTAMLTAILNLDARQQAEVRRVLTTAAAERQSIAQQTDRDARRAAMQALHQRTEANLEAVLDANQRATLDRMQAVREARRTEHANRPVATPATPATPARRGR